MTTGDYLCIKCVACMSNQMILSTYFNREKYPIIFVEISPLCENTFLILWFVQNYIEYIIDRLKG